ncbi:MAG: aromatic ring-hydroxylating dioxygenase subunit alpha [Burkholderiaceae bacterium]
MFIRNCWYVIAWDHEIGADALFSRRVLDEPILVYRTSNGALTALEDRCCHRLAPLSLGRKEGDNVRCGYHGLKFDPSGRCIEVPGSAQVPAAARVKTYPVTVKNKWVFVWMGDPEKADALLLPDNFSNDHPDWRNKPGYLHYDTSYQLVCDNLLDFSHLSYVHEKTLGGSPMIAQARADIEDIARGIRVTRRVPNVPAPPFYQRFRQFDTLLNRWFIYDFVLPGTLLMHSGGAPVDDAPGELRNAVQLHSCQTLTPETATTTHYFFQQSHRAGAGDAQIVQSIYDSLVAAFNEDRAMITAQAESITRSPAARMMPLAMDAALIRFRRLIDVELEKESRPEAKPRRRVSAAPAPAPPPSRVRARGK